VAVDGLRPAMSFTACLIVSLLENRTREEALRRAVHRSALAASRFGAQDVPTTADEVDALL